MRLLPGIVFILSLFILSCGTKSQPIGDEADQEAQNQEEIPTLSKAELDALALFTEPQLSDAELAALKAKYPGLDPQGVVPKKLLDKALAYYDANKNLLGNTRYLSVLDFSAPSTLPRLYIIDMGSGTVWPLHVSHGSGSDRDNDAFAESFSNIPNSNASSLGYYKTAETYMGKHGYSLRLDGLSSTNSNARRRAVVMHGAKYVRDANVKQGRSWGCPAVSMKVKDEVINKLKNGSLIYAGLTDSN